MSLGEWQEWERRYRQGEYQPRWEPSSLLVEWLLRLPRGRALDVACGNGRNALFLASQGYTVDAIDIAASALALGRQRAFSLGLRVNWVQADLDSNPLSEAAYDLIVVSFYINRALAPSLVDTLRPGGALVYEHHLKVPQPVDGPTKPEHRFAPGELKRLFSRLEVLHYEEGVFQEGERRHAHARLVAAKETSPPGPLS